MKARPAVALGQPAVPELEQAKPGIGFERPGMRSWPRVFFLPCRPLPPLFFGRSAPIRASRSGQLLVKRPRSRPKKTNAVRVIAVEPQSCATVGTHAAHFHAFAAEAARSPHIRP